MSSSRSPRERRAQQLGPKEAACLRAIRWYHLQRGSASLRTRQPHRHHGPCSVARFPFLCLKVGWSGLTRSLAGCFTSSKDGSMLLHRPATGQSRCRSRARRPTAAVPRCSIAEKTTSWVRPDGHAIRPRLPRLIDDVDWTGMSAGMAGCYSATERQQRDSARCLISAHPCTPPPPPPPPFSTHGSIAVWVGKSEERRGGCVLHQVRTGLIHPDHICGAARLLAFRHSLPRPDAG